MTLSSTVCFLYCRLESVSFFLLSYLLTVLHNHKLVAFGSKVFFMLLSITFVTSMNGWADNVLMAN